MKWESLPYLLRKQIRCLSREHVGEKRYAKEQIKKDDRKAHRNVF